MGSSDYLINYQIPHTETIEAGTSGATTSSTAYTFPSVSPLCTITKHLAETKLIVQIAGGIFLDDAVANGFIGIQIDAPDAGPTNYDVCRYESVAGANQAGAFAGWRTFTGVAGVWTARQCWRVNAGTVVATQTGFWCVMVTETM